MVTVMASGVFDLLHIGHVKFLNEAKALGDRLVVVVASDNTVRKKKREPVVDQYHRAELIGYLKPVDEVIIGGEGDMFDTVASIDPDIIALGYDQDFDEEWLSSELKHRGLKAKVVRLKHYLADLDHTRKIINKVIDIWSMQVEIEGIEERGRKKFSKS